MALGPKKREALLQAGVHERLIEDLEARPALKASPDLIQQTVEHLAHVLQERRDNLSEFLQALLRSTSSGVVEAAMMDAHGGNGRVYLFNPKLAEYATDLAEKILGGEPP